MALALASSTNSVFTAPRGLPSVRIRAQNFEHHHEAGGHNLVDANLGILRKRIEEMKTKEKLKKCYERGSLAGWNHLVQYSGSKSRLVSSSAYHPSEYVEMVGTVGGTLGLTILGGTLGLCVASVLVHLTQLSVVGIGP